MRFDFSWTEPEKQIASLPANYPKCNILYFGWYFSKQEKYAFSMLYLCHDWIEFS